MMQDTRRTHMDKDATLTGNALPDDILPDGLPRILPPYENGIFQAVIPKSE